MSAPPEPETLVDLDDRERRVYGRFLRKVGDGPAAFFLDACRMMKSDPRPLSASHLVGHAIREIESGLRALLVPLTATHPSRENLRLRQIRKMLLAAGMDEFDSDAEWWFRVAEEKGGETQNEQIDAVLAELGIAETEAVALTWKRLSGATRAHRPGLRVRPVNPEFEAYWDDAVGLFDALLERLEHRYLEYYRMLDDLLTLQYPTADDVKRLDERIPRSVATYKYFFEQLSWPSWFPPLRKRKFFANPFAWYWPPAVYLTRVAERYPNEVLFVMFGAETDSALTHAEFAQTAMNLPPTEAAQWTRHEVEWIGRQERIGWPLPQAYGKLVAHVAPSDIDAALTLTEAVLADGKPADEQHGLIEEKRAKVEWYELQLFMTDAVPALAVRPELALPRLVKILSTILAPKDVDVGWDSSRYWRGHVAEDRVLTPGRRNELVTAIRNIATDALQRGAMTMPDMLRILDGERHPIFRRIARFLLAEHPEGEADRIAQELRDVDLLGRDHGEHRHLARKGFRVLSAADQAALLARIDAGPDVNEFRERVRAFRGTDATDDEVTAYVLRWQISTGEVIHDAADAAFRHRHEEREHALSTIDARRSAEIVLLKTAAELRDLSGAEVVEYVQRFLAGPSPSARNPEELGLCLQQAVAADPEYFTVNAEIFSALPPSFVNRYMQGIVEGLRSGRPVRWEAVFDLLDVVLRNPIDIAVGERQEATWAWTRQHIAWLVAAVFGAETITLPVACAPRLWTVIIELLNTPANDEALLEPDGETVADRALVRAMNSVRATAFDAATEFVLWVREHATLDEPRYRETLFTMAETLLVEPTATLRAAFGRAIGWLQGIDEGWLNDHIASILPAPELDADGWEAAFAGIVGRWIPSRHLFELLRPSYLTAIERIRENERFARSHTADRVAQHLAIFYWRGDITFDDSLLQGFFENAAGKLRGRLQWAIASHLDAVAGEVGQAVQQRIDELWNRRVADGATAEDRSEEFTWFGFYFETYQGNMTWAMQTLKAVLETGVTISDHRVVEKLARIAPTHATLAFECYALLIQNEQRDRFLIYEESGRDILRAALASEASARARDFIHELASEGILAFRDLLTDADDIRAIVDSPTEWM